MPISEHGEVLNVLHRYYATIDERDWRQLRSLMDFTIALDLGGAGPDGETPADDFVAFTAGLLDPIEFSQHMIGNAIVSVDGDQAQVAFYETALLHHSALSDDPAINTWIFRARCEMGLRRQSGGWQVVSTRLRGVQSDGNPRLLVDAAP